MSEEENISKLTPCTEDELNELSDIEFHIQQRLAWLEGFEVFMRGTSPHLDPTGREKYYAVGLRIIPHESVEHMHCPPTFTLNWESASGLMDALWECGVRPSERFVPTPTTLKATERHLDDMRKLVFEK